ncbi:hypothetical protein DFH08DRAFT_799601 [Mycena albidolilacea]|uniref:Uncharacterized protein n=1 Tax=Mycena albidolilacea TaxID=1033008 RepID=A0AAD7ALV2_9AGAR|nr:hypothetical protein DFH08DRAFT_799601 [Mycena albidolilacea]
MALSPRNIALIVCIPILAAVLLAGGTYLDRKRAIRRSQALRVRNAAARGGDDPAVGSASDSFGFQKRFGDRLESEGFGSVLNHDSWRLICDDELDLRPRGVNSKYAVAGIERD